MATRLNLTVTAVPDSQDIARNESYVDILLTITTDSGTYNETGDTSGYVTLDGVEIANLAAKKVYYQTTTELYSGRHLIKHAADGSKSVSVKAGFDVNTSIRWIYAERVLTLPRIPRASALTFPVFTMGAAGEIKLTRYVAGYEDELRYTFGSVSGVIVERTGADSVMWTPPTEELAPQVAKDDSKGVGTLYVRTYDADGNYIGENSCPFTAQLPAEAVPFGTISTSPASDTVPKSWDEYVRGESRMNFSINASGSYGADIKSCVFSIAGQTIEGARGTTDIFAIANEYTPQAVLTDARERTATIYGEKIVVRECSPPEFKTLEVFRSDSNYNPKGDGTYLTISCNAICSSVNGKNAVSIKMRSRTTNGSYPSRYKSVANNSRVLFDDFSATTSFVVEVVAEDSLKKKKTIEVKIPTDAVAFHLRDGGKGAAFGTYAQEDNLTCEWDAVFRKNVAAESVDVTSGLSAGSVTATGTVTAADVIIGGKSLLDLLHPVGSYHISDDPTEPSTLFGGTWVKVEGRFLLGTGGGYAVGGEGGEATHALTVSEMPNHTHNFNYVNSDRGVSWSSNAINDWGSAYSSDAAVDMQIGAGWSSTGYLTLIGTGGNQPHNNMPPYRATNIWRRTA